MVVHVYQFVRIYSMSELLICEAYELVRVSRVIRVKAIANSLY